MYVDHAGSFSVSARQRAREFIDQSLSRADGMSAEEFLLCMRAVPAFADIPAPPRIGAWLAGRDPGLRAIESELRQLAAA